MEQTGGAAVELAAYGVPAAETVIEHGPVKVVAAPAEAERAFQEISRIGRADKMNRSRDHAADGRVGIDRAMADFKKSAVDGIGAAGGGLGGLNEVLDRSVGDDRVELPGK